MAETKPSSNSIEATGVLVRVGLEWFVQVEFDDGTLLRSDESFASKIDAEAALQAWCEAHGISSYRAQ